MGTFQRSLAAFSEEQTSRLTGLSAQQLRYWDKTDFYRPSFAEQNRRIAFSRIYSFKDIVALRVLHVLRNQYRISLQHLRDVSQKLSHLGDNPDCWLATKLYPLNGRVVWYEAGSELPQVITSGQYVAAVVLDEVVQHTKNAVADLQTARDQKKIGKLEQSRFIQHNALVISGTRIPVAAVQRFGAAGYSVEQIIKEYPDLTQADVEAALKYKKSPKAA